MRQVAMFREGILSTLDLARQLLSQGRVAEAERACEQVLEHSPNAVEALNVCAVKALRDRHHDRAVELLERAVEVAPNDPVSQHNLGRAYEAGGRIHDAIDALTRAVRLRPVYHVARVRLAALLEARGDRDRAVLQYARALEDAQRQGRWLDAEGTPASLRPLVERAVNTVRTHRVAALGELVARLEQAYGPEAMERIAAGVRIYLKQQAPEFPDPRQQPTFFYVPGLPATPYFDRTLFPWIEEFEAQTGAIRAELLELLPSPRGSERVFTSDELEQRNLRSEAGPASWTGFYFYRHGEPRPENCARCPKTASAVDRLPLSVVPGHGPEVLYSVFKPGTHLLPHRGVTNTRVVGHLPLVVPPDCALSVGGELHAWQEGRVVVFDDTYEHEAWNRSDRTRVVLIFDLWNPHLTEAERAAARDVVVDVSEFRLATQQA
jgi:aspartate beta-hydroxylase